MTAKTWLSLRGGVFADEAISKLRRGGLKALARRPEIATPLRGLAMTAPLSAARIGIAKIKT